MTDHITRAAAIVNEANWKADFKGGARADEIARALDGAGLLASPEHDAAVAARTLREDHDLVNEAIRWKREALRWKNEVKRLREVVAVADRVAASLGLVLHDAHPTYGSTALWRGGVGGRALTPHCSIVNGAHPGGEWAEFDLPSHYLREWVSLRGADYDHNEMKATVRADLLALLNPTEGGDDDSVQAH